MIQPHLYLVPEAPRKAHIQKGKSGFVALCGVEVRRAELTSRRPAEERICERCEATAQKQFEDAIRSAKGEA